MKGPVLLFLKLLVSGAILFACFVYTDIKSFWQALWSVDLRYSLAILVVTIVGSIVVPAMITKEALAGDMRHMSVRDLVMINFSVRFYTLIFPRGLAAGVRFLKYRQRGNGEQALALLIFEKVAQIFMLTLTASFFLWLDADRLAAVASYLFFIALAGLMVSSVCLLTFFSRFFYRLCARRFGLIAGLTPRVVGERLRALARAVQAMQRFGGRKVLAIFSLSSLGYALFILGPYILTIAMDLDLGLRAIAWVRSLTLLIALVPVTIAGLGVREASFVAFLGLYGIANHQALAFSIFLFAIHIVIGLVGASIEFWNHVVKPTRSVTAADKREVV